MACFALTVEGQQQSPPIWDRSGMPTAQGAAGKNVSADKAVTDVGWERYSPGGEEFSALLPGRPFKSYLSRPRKMFEEPKGGWSYSAYADGTVYIIQSLDNPRRKEALEVFINEFQKSHPHMTFERDVTLDGFKGKQYRMTASTQSSISGIVQFYLAKDHACIFLVVSDKMEGASVNKFLTSLKLDGKTKGKDIAEVSRLISPPANKSLPSSAGEANKGKEQSKVMNPREVTRKAILVMKPQPGYTEEARKNQISGTVTLRAVLSSSGEVRSIRPVSNLPHGLTERAIVAARGIRFIPAIKDGSYVSQYVTIEYNFNLY
jgi:TonB family protein